VTGLGTGGKAETAVATQGAATVDDEITVIIPKKGDSGFFKVERK